MAEQIVQSVNIDVPAVTLFVVVCGPFSAPDPFRLPCVGTSRSRARARWPKRG